MFFLRITNERALLLLIIHGQIQMRLFPGLVETIGAIESSI